VNADAGQQRRERPGARRVSCFNGTAASHLPKYPRSCIIRVNGKSDYPGVPRQLSGKQPQCER
jgi:hypothetical protein